MSNLATYPYLVSTLWLIALASLPVLFLPRQRYMLLLSGALATPLAVYAYQHTPWYWTPRRLSDVAPSIEDFLFMASMGTLAWFWAVVLGAKRWQARPVLGARFACIYGAAWLAGVPASEIARRWLFQPADVMYVHVGMLLFFCVLLLWRRPDAWPLAVCGGLLNGLSYLTFLLIYFPMFPGYLDNWNPQGQLGWEVLGVPCFEIAWPASFGACWPVFLVYSLDIRRGRVCLVPAGADSAPNAELTLSRPGAGVHTPMA